MSTSTLSGEVKIKVEGPAYNRAERRIEDTEVEIEVSFGGWWKYLPSNFLDPPESEWDVTVDQSSSEIMALVRSSLHWPAFNPVGEERWHEAVVEALEQHVGENLQEYRQ